MSLGNSESDLTDPNLDRLEGGLPDPLLAGCVVIRKGTKIARLCEHDDGVFISVWLDGLGLRCGRYLLPTQPKRDWELAPDQSMAGATAARLALQRLNAQEDRAYARARCP